MIPRAPRGRGYSSVELTRLAEDLEQRNRRLRGVLRQGSGRDTRARHARRVDGRDAEVAGARRSCAGRGDGRRARGAGARGRGLMRSWSTRSTSCSGSWPRRRGYEGGLRRPLRRGLDGDYAPVRGRRGFHGRRASRSAVAALVPELTVEVRGRGVGRLTRSAPRMVDVVASHPALAPARDRAHAQPARRDPGSGGGDPRHRGGRLAALPRRHPAHLVRDRELRPRERARTPARPTRTWGWST